MTMTVEGTETKVVAAFDFDKTLTHQDTFLPSLIYSRGFFISCWCLLWALPWLIAWGLGMRTRQQAKERVLKCFFGGRPYSEVALLGKKFASGPIERFVIPERLERLRWHQQQGHRCFLISASMRIFLEEWAKKQGFDDLLASEFEVDEAGRVTGKLKGLNCRGQEKVRRLLERMNGQKDFTLYAYGDSQGDKELLDLADYPYYKEKPGRVP